MNDATIVVGAGVLGLSSAIQLARQGHAVTVIARELPGDFDIEYASPWAGAHFRPTPANNASERFEQELMHETYEELKAMAESHPDSSVRFVRAVEYFDAASPAYSDETLVKQNGYADWPDFRILDQSELPSDHDAIQLGVTYTGWVLNSPVYLTWLHRQAQELGVRFIRARLTALEEAVFIHRENESAPRTNVRAVINASGRGFHDPDSFPSRGQFILVSNPCNETISHHWADGSTTVIIPRPLGGGTVIGGTKESNNWSPSISNAATGTILARAAKLYAPLVSGASSNQDASGFDIKQVYIGRRPMRKGGLRLEKQILDFQDTAEDGLKSVSRSIPVVHCYGAGASGFKISWGVARRVARLVAAT
ncbi:FAD dependent oxidoreductase superfamily [Penicillium riverlandense]|uniref:FAD dependent oxidoreductase superfamily n=1 Tax=Penicillium riverlandense TaxID=1903569 RepID=UPI002548AF26|nr:FAD dependent oxidoreductase superfamily [Penicillium riverlandense]KAJ5825201.1 FAD dependent oxidoreductase superfamily [Penicillium riverlandense]